MQPQKISDVDLAFPATVSHLMPKFEEIPTGYPNETKWRQFQSDWFYAGIKAKGIKVKEGIDRRDAFRHLQAIQGSFEPSHEHKEAAVAYLASLWFLEDSTW